MITVVSVGVQAITGAILLFCKRPTIFTHLQLTNHLREPKLTQTRNRYLNYMDSIQNE